MPPTRSAGPSGKATGVVLHPVFRHHLPAPGHPDSPARYDAISRAISGLPWQPIAPRLAVWEEILLCHDIAYLESVQTDFRRGRRQLSTGDTDISPRSLEIARTGVGAVLQAVDA